MCVFVCVCLGVGGQAGARVILLISESCHRPLVGESLSGGVTFTDNKHAVGGGGGGGGSGLSLGGVGGSLSVAGTS